MEKAQWHKSTIHPPVEEEVIALRKNEYGWEICFAHQVKEPYLVINYDGWNIDGIEYWQECPKFIEDNNY